MLTGGKMPIKTKINLDKLMKEYTTTKPLKTSELFILGLLSYKDTSGYDIYKLIAKKSQVAGSFLRLNKTTVYNTISRLCEEGLIEIKEIIKNTKYPNKSIYKLTPAGKKHLKGILINEFSNPPWIFLNFTLPLRFSKILSKDELLEIVQLKIQQTEAILNLSKMLYGKLFQDSIIELMMENSNEHYEVSLKFLYKLKSELEKRSVNELFKINEFDVDKIMAKVKVITKNGGNEK
jgi:DNA-binding PadR family transcriptional regulator